MTRRNEVQHFIADIEENGWMLGCAADRVDPFPSEAAD